MTALRERVDEATTRKIKWNGWPDKMELVGLTEVDHTDPFGMMQFGYRLGAAGEYRQIDLREFPSEIQAWLRRHDVAYTLINVRIGYADMRGQEDAEETRNIYLLISPRHGYDRETRKTTFDRPGLIIELGCAHDYETIASGNCWSRHRCLRCGHEWEVDSSG